MIKSRSIIMLSLIVLVGIFITYTLRRKDAVYNEYKCLTKAAEIRDVILYISGRSSYVTVQVKETKKVYSLNIRNIVVQPQCFSSPAFQEGDSIIKDSNSNYFRIKRGNCMAVYELDCDD